MLDSFNKYWPLISIGAFTAASIFNIGYFGTLGFHFIGLMDLSNVVYTVGISFGLLMGISIFFSGQLIDDLKDLAKHQNSIEILQRIFKITTPILAVGFAIGLFSPRYISTLGLFSLYFVIASSLSYLYAFVLWFKFQRIPSGMTMLLVFATMLTISFLGSYKAQYEAFYSTQRYNIITKNGGLYDVRIARTSSNGFIIGHRETVIFIPMSQVNYIEAINR